MAVSYNLINCSGSSIYNVTNSSFEESVGEYVTFEEEGNVYQVQKNKQYIFKIPVFYSGAYTLNIQNFKINAETYLTSPYSKIYPSGHIRYFDFSLPVNNPPDFPTDYEAGISKNINFLPTTTVIKANSTLVFDFEEVARTKDDNHVYFRPYTSDDKRTDRFFAIQCPEATEVLIEGIITYSSTNYPFSLHINTDGTASFLFNSAEFFQSSFETQAFYLSAFDQEILAEVDGCPDCSFYKLTNCSTWEVLITSNDFSTYVGKTTKLQDKSGCWIVEAGVYTNDSRVTDSFKDCKFCLPECLKPECQ